MVIVSRIQAYFTWSLIVQKTILDDALSLYLRALVNDFQHNGLFTPTLFPPKDLQLEELNNLVRLVGGFRII